MTIYLNSLLLQVTLFTFVKFIVFFVGPYFFFWKWYGSYFLKYKIQLIERQKPQVQIELFFSFISLGIQIIFLSLLVWFLQKKNISLTWHFGSKGYFSELMAIFGYLVIYDAYFYWSHRLLHQRWFYKKIHSVHHRSLNPNPFSSYSFHPIEALINLVYLIPVTYFFPMSFETFTMLLVLTDFTSLAGHLGYEFLPQQVIEKWWGRWLTTPTHHNLHHQISKTNFGLYCIWWDQFFGTLNPNTSKEFLQIKKRS